MISCQALHLVMCYSKYCPFHTLRKIQYCIMVFCFADKTMCVCVCVCVLHRLLQEQINAVQSSIEWISSMPVPHVEQDRGHTNNSFLLVNDNLPKNLVGSLFFLLFHMVHNTCCIRVRTQTDF